ncbi:MAG TPA: RluA family pseudouridine synthase [Candidatus Polarisedimenticolaceae bacterium]|nr:RluA family pseudouridine synthase [Candidatus Polarisedimenticolaceae bacterium]
MENRGFEYRERVDRRADGRTLLEHLARRYTHSSRERWAERILSGQVLVDGERSPPDRLLGRGQRVVWRRPGWVEPAVPLGFAVLFEDDRLLAVAKPAGLPTLPGGGFLEHTLLALVRRHYPSASPLHRLGRWTSGVVLCARSREAGAALSAAWRDRRVIKRYRALAVGRPARRRFRVDYPIGPVAYPPLGTLFAASPAGKPATSVVEVVEQRQGEFLADVTIETGRPHQIRIHLAAAGHPLAGDPLYAVGGLPCATGDALPGDPGYRLHAASIEFEHPASGARVTVACRTPVDLCPSVTRGSAASSSGRAPV